MVKDWLQTQMEKLSPERRTEVEARVQDSLEKIDRQEEEKNLDKD